MFIEWLLLQLQRGVGLHRQLTAVFRINLLKGKDFDIAFFKGDLKKLLFHFSFKS